MWKQIGSPPLKKKQKKQNRMARGVSGKKLMCRISFPGKTLKCSEWIVLFELWQLPINSYCNRVNVSSKSKNKGTEKLVEDLKNCFDRVFLEGLRK